MKPFLTAAAVALLSAPGLSYGENAGPPLPFGIVYPSYALAPIVDPASLSLGKCDDIEMAAGLPFVSDTSVQETRWAKSNARPPGVVAYGGCMKPIGIGMAVESLSPTDTTLYAGAGFGIERFQVAAQLVDQPDLGTHSMNYTFRMGGSQGFAAAITWNEGQTSTAGLGYYLGYFAAEIDTRFGLDFSSNAAPSAKFGLITDSVSASLGYAPASLKELRPAPTNLNAAMAFPIGKTCQLNVYYHGWLDKIAGGIVFHL